MTRRPALAARRLFRPHRADRADLQTPDEQGMRTADGCLCKSGHPRSRQARGSEWSLRWGPGPSTVEDPRWQPDCAFLNRRPDPRLIRWCRSRDRRPPRPHAGERTIGYGLHTVGAHPPRRHRRRLRRHRQSDRRWSPRRAHRVHGSRVHRRPHRTLDRGAAQAAGALHRPHQRASLPGAVVDHRRRALRGAPAPVLQAQVGGNEERR